MTILDTVHDPALFAPLFAGETWRAWQAFLAHLFALPMDAELLQIGQQYTGGRKPPEKPPREAWLVKGRRAGGSRIAALIAVYLGCLRDYGSVLSAGERGVVMVLASDRRQARVIFGYVKALLEAVPMLHRLIVRERAESIDLSNGISIEIHTASFRSVRGYTCVAAILDEVAFWRDESTANPDVEIVHALRPAMATIPGALLLGISSPYARRGVLWDSYHRYFGRDGPVLVWQAASRAMNPTLPEELVDRALEEDPAAARAEWLGEFRKDVETFVSREAVDACVVPERRELPPVDGVSYVGFVDPSGGSADSMTLAIAHEEKGDRKSRTILDAVREIRPPFSPEAAVGQFVETLKRFRISQVSGDRYAAEWVAEAFRKAGVQYKPAEKVKSDLYRELLPAINSQTVELLDHPKLFAQLCGLERRTARGGRDSIDHAPNAHDHLANAVAGVVQLVLGKRGWGFDDLYGPNGLYERHGVHVEDDESEPGWVRIF